MTKYNKICNRCVMDSRVKDIIFYDLGCNFCQNGLNRIKDEIIKPHNRERELKKLKSTISTEKKYDCLIGISGGVDSTYVAYLVKKKLKLNPLAVHLDNGWNSKKSTKNIYDILKKLDIDLITHVIDWKEFRGIQQALLKSNIQNFEIATDHAILATMIKTSLKYDIKYILHGGNVATESIMPASWMEPNYDFSLIKKIVKKYSKVKIKTLPRVNVFTLFFALFIKRIKYIPLLNYVNYDRDEAIRILKNELGYEPYGEKHFESIVTKFFQSYLLPKKFSIDKRRAHLSSMIISNQITREEALKILDEPFYKDKVIENEEREYFIKKMKISNDELDEIVNNKNKLTVKGNLYYLQNSLLKYRGLIRKLIK